MNLKQLKQQIQDNNIDNWYIFTGEEHKVLNIYIDMMSKSANANKCYADDLVSVVSKSRQASLIKNRTIYVIMDDKDFLKNEKAWESIEREGAIKDDIIIFYYTTQDKRMKFWKRFENRVVEFEHLDKRLLTKYIHKELPGLADNYCEKLIELCENDYGRILLETDKIKRIDDKPNDVFRKFLAQGVIYQPPKDAIFDFVSAVMSRDVEKSFDLLEQSYAVGEANMVILSVLYTSFRNLLLVQSRRKGQNIGLSGWNIKLVSDYVGNYSNGELVRALKIIRSLEVGIKRGEISDDITVYKFLVEVI